MTDMPADTIYAFSTWEPLLRLIRDADPGALAAPDADLSGYIAPRYHHLPFRPQAWEGVGNPVPPDEDDAVKRVLAALPAAGLASVSFKARFQPGRHVALTLHMDPVAPRRDRDRMKGAITRYDDALPEPWRRLPEEFPDARPHESHDPERLERLLREWYPSAVGATAEEVAAAEERIGRPLPEELKAVYRITRDPASSGEPIDEPRAPGWIYDLMGECLLPIDQVYVRDSNYRMPSWSVAVTAAPRTPPGAAVQQLVGSPGWIVFANDYAAFEFAVDLTPGATGHVGQVIALDYDEHAGARLEARSLTDFVLTHDPSDVTETSRDNSAVAYVHDRSFTSIEATAHADLEALFIGVCDGVPFSLAPLFALPKLRVLTAHPGTLANPLEIARLTHLEYLAIGVADWRMLLDADALPPNLLAANIQGSRNPLLEPPPGSAIYRELTNEIAARWGRIHIRTTLIEGDLP